MDPSTKIALGLYVLGFVPSYVTLLHLDPFTARDRKELVTVLLMWPAIVIAGACVMVFYWGALALVDKDGGDAEDT